MPEIIVDQDNRTFALLKTRLRKTEGTRWASRASIAKVIRGEQRHVSAGSSHPNAKTRWGAAANSRKMRIGCRTFTGENFRKLKEWALA